MARIVENRSAAAASSTVAGQRCSSTICIAGRFSRIDVPKSPRGTARRKSRYCTCSARSRPKLRRASAISCCVALWSTRNGVGSPVSRTRKKTAVTTPHSTNTACSARRSRKARIGPGSSLHSDAAEVHVELWRLREAQRARAVRVDLDLLVERHHRGPIAHLALEIGEELEPLLRVDLAACG